MRDVQWTPDASTEQLVAMQIGRRQEQMVLAAEARKEAITADCCARGMFEGGFYHSEIWKAKGETALDAGRGLIDDLLSTVSDLGDTVDALEWAQERLKATFDGWLQGLRSSEEQRLSRHQNFVRSSRQDLEVAIGTLKRESEIACAKARLRIINRVHSHVGSSHEEIVELKPNFMGFGFNLRALWRRLRRKDQRRG